MKKKEKLSTLDGSEIFYSIKLRSYYFFPTHWIELEEDKIFIFLIILSVLFIGFSRNDIVYGALCLKLK